MVTLYHPELPPLEGQDRREIEVQEPQVPALLARGWKKARGSKKSTEKEKD